MNDGHHAHHVTNCVDGVVRLKAQLALFENASQILEPRLLLEVAREVLVFVLAVRLFDDRADDFVLDDDGRGKGLFFVSLRAGPLISGPSGSLTIRTGSSKAPQKRPR